MSSSLFARKPTRLLLQGMAGETRLRPVLGSVQLTGLGVGAIIGAGIFIVIGLVARDKAGAATMLSFVIAGLACGFAALCYAEFASMVPVAGSAYTYAYATLGEIFAWIIGWDLLLEYGVGAASVAHGWSHYFTDFLGLLGATLPRALIDAPFEFNPATGRFFSTGAIIDLPALLISAFLTIVLVIGIRLSATFNALMVAVKLAVVFLIVAVGVFYIDPQNWHPFAPYGYSGLSFFGKTIAGQQAAGGEPLGVMAGAAIVFYAYIGFDPSRPCRGGAQSQSRRTHRYCRLACPLHGSVYRGGCGVNRDGSLRQDRHQCAASAAFSRVGLPWQPSHIDWRADRDYVGLDGVMLSQPRIMLAMARDGLLPASFFGSVHARFRTPWKSTVLTGIAVGLMGAFCRSGCSPSW